MQKPKSRLHPLVDISEPGTTFYPLLRSLGEIHKYLKFSSLRHSGITRLVRAGVDVAAIARLAGTSPEMILNNYLAAREDIDLPPM